MPSSDSLRRLGGGRWETRDGRFAIEPQSGTWVVVDSSQTDELGLPLVRGPFGSLTAAREAIEGVRSAGPAESPLADRLRQSRAAGTKEPEPERPKPRPAPKWLADLAPPEGRRARDLIERLESLGIAEAVEIARAEIVMDQPALARLGLERSLRKVIASAKNPGDAVRAATGVLSGGRDRELDVRWRLVDDRGRRVSNLDLDG
jgi:hypothetical protein